jgi:glycosyltransferase involved in cell wall biosynthesis
LDNLKVNYITPGQFGTFNHIYQIAKILISRGYDVSYFGVFEGLKHRDLFGLNVCEAFSETEPSSKRGGLQVRLTLFKLLYKRRQQFQNIETVNIVTYFVGCSLLLFFVKNIVLDIRTFSVHPKPQIRMFFDAVLKLESLFFRQVTVLSEDMMRKLFYSRNVSVVPLGGPKFDFHEKSSCEMRVLYVGTLKHRNILSTVKAFHEFLLRRPMMPARFDIIGRGDDAQKVTINEYINKNTLNEKVIFHGEVNFPEVTAFYLDSNVGLSYVPITEYYDSQPPTKTFEYLLAGMFVIATDTSENRKVIKSNNGCLTGDSIVDILGGFLAAADRISNVDFLAIYSESQKHSWDEIVQNYLMPVVMERDMFDKRL